MMNFLVSLKYISSNPPPPPPPGPAAIGDGLAPIPAPRSAGKSLVKIFSRTKEKIFSKTLVLNINHYRPQRSKTISDPQNAMMDEIRNGVKLRKSKNRLDSQ